ncbi:hypothetical protein M422DRAFT_255419 [Sphaerobolus stellatus SS14]|uniref:Uncharacterized protein n=1 Tax=Sphaerobolus stellatus (strain SS14) TaxID=990650 RepID=A0A0C9VTP4_SPHS4|nr:hypothetical protein M422DRAFT_255419 [Sphaerobolus stellatus SS14]
MLLALPAALLLVEETFLGLAAAAVVVLNFTAGAAKPKNVSSTKSKAAGKASNILVSRKVLETLSKNLGLCIAALTTQASRVNKDKLSVDNLLE